MIEEVTHEYKQGKGAGGGLFTTTLRLMRDSYGMKDKPSTHSSCMAVSFDNFKELILNRLELSRKELTFLNGLITRKDESGTEDTENRMSVDDGSNAMERENLSQMASRQIQFISNLEKALIRIENKTYGICRVTGLLIDKARLRAVPHATLSIEAKNGMKK